MTKVIEDSATNIQVQNCWPILLQVTICHLDVHFKTNQLYMPSAQCVVDRQLDEKGIPTHRTGMAASTEMDDVPKFRCLPSATLVSWNPCSGSWLISRVSSWHAMLFPGTVKYRNAAFSISSFKRCARIRPSRSSVCNAIINQNPLG